VECVLDAHFGIRGAVISQNEERIIVIEKGSANSEEILDKLDALHISRVITVKEIPMDKRHGAKIDYERLKNIFKN